MTMELLNRGADMKTIYNHIQQSTSEDCEIENVQRVLKEIINIPNRVTDQPTVHDNLGRNVFAEGLAALFLNPHVKSPITVSISGERGAGKSSLMIQTENIMLKMVAYLTCKKTNLLKDPQQSKEREDPMDIWLKEYPEQDRHAILKSLAVMDRSESVTKNGGKANPHTEGQMSRTIPAILTVCYNSWQYRNEDEAWAGLIVKITKEIEDAMTPAQLLCTSWKYSWTTARNKMWLGLILPALLAIILGGLVAWATWTLLSRSAHKPLEGLKYGSIPITVVTIMWVVMKSAMDVVKPISSQMGECMKLPNHANKLGYQHTVMDDIKFLKQELTSAPSLFYASIIWFLNLFCICSNNNVGYQRLCKMRNNNVGFRRLCKMRPASGDNLKIIVFVDDLDRCEHTVILKVLSAVNLVLTTCQINAILAMDTQIIDQAIERRYRLATCEINTILNRDGQIIDQRITRMYQKNAEIVQDVADKYRHKIFQLSLCLPDPSDMESQQFLERQLGVSESLGQQTNQPNSIEQEKSIGHSEWNNFDNFFEELKLKLQTEGTNAEEFCVNALKEIQNQETERDDLLNIKFEDRLQTDNDDNESPEDDQYDSIYTRLKDKALTFPQYTTAERKTLDCLRTHATGSRKVPREWKRFLYYHRLAWNILSNYKGVKELPRWQAQLVVWIFVCWEWRLPMNNVIRNWDRVAFGSETIKSNIDQDEYGTDGEGPSLKEIVKQCCEGKWAEDGREIVEKATEDPDKIDQKTWERLIEFLEHYSLSVQAILLFQQFRFECENGYLKSPTPLSRPDIH